MLAKRVAIKYITINNNVTLENASTMESFMETQTIIKKELHSKSDKSLIITAELKNFNISNLETKELLVEAVSELVKDFGLVINCVDFQNHKQ